MNESETLPAIPEQKYVVSAADFEAAMEDGRLKAQTLAKIVEERGLYANIQGKKYLEVEAWETIGRAYGYTAKVEWTRRVDGGGWEARAVVVDAYGTEVGAAEHEAGTQGDTPWDKRPSNVQRSMAQTRAVSKALRSVLSWVVQLAGYQPTPANEMPDEVRNPDPSMMCPVHGVAWFKKGKMKDYAHPIENDGVTIAWCNRDDVQREHATQAPRPSGQLGEDEIKRLFALGHEAGLSREQFEDAVRSYGVSQPKNLTSEQYTELCSYLESLAGAAQSPGEAQS